MIRSFVGAALAAALWACGGPPLPASASPDAGPPPPAEDPTTSRLWPLTAGSTWTYQITGDRVHGSFVKHVEVVGESLVPETEHKAIAVRSTQPHIEELSWQVVRDGKVYRVREEDRRSGTLFRVVTWRPDLIKALATPQSVGWSATETIVEKERDQLGTVTAEKDKIYQWTIEAVNETVGTPAGTFAGAIKVRRVRTDGKDWERIYWFVPGVGKVREEGERIEELLRFDVK